MIIGNTEKISARIEAILSDQDFKIFFSNDQKDGLKIAARYLPNLILYCSSAIKNDLEPIKEICSDENLATVPLIIIADNFSFDEQRVAMESGADDYVPAVYLERSLLNSIKKRFVKLSRIKQTVHNSINSFDEYNEAPGNNDHILVKIGNKLKLVEFSDIVCITALKEYSKMITNGNSKIVVRKSLKSWVDILPSGSFLRIHRATIININYIEEITKTNERTYTVHLKNIKETFDFSHRYANIMRHTFPT